MKNGKTFKTSTHRKLLKSAANKTPVLKDLLRDRRNLQEALDISNQQLGSQVSDIRTLLSYKYIRGKGIEIGALHMPLSLHKDAKAKYVDYIPLAKLRKHYPELNDLDLVHVDIVDNGEKLTKVENLSQDFIVANHFLEHCQDPIGTIITFLNKLKGGGILYMAVPDMRYTFDMYRPLTTYSHLLEEHAIYPSKKFYAIHCREIAKLTDRLNTKNAIEQRVKDLTDRNYSIHYHVWTQKELVDFFYRTAEKFSLDLEIEAMANNVHEVIFIIKKRNSREESQKIKAIEKHYFGNVTARSNK